MKFLFLILLALLGFSSLAQIGGNSSYEFLRLSNSARITALGGSLITVKDGDVNLAFKNPAALNPLMHQRVAFNQSVYMGGITYGYLAYAQHFPSLPLTVQAGLYYIDYGKFKNTSVNETALGESRAAEYAINIGAAYQMSKFLSVGLNCKTILSYLGSYNSTGMAFDLSTMYNDTAKRIAFTVAFQNIGSQFTSYARNQNMEPLPFDLQIGIAHRLKYIPLRFSVIMHDLHRWGIVYSDPAYQNNQLLISDGSTPKIDYLGQTVDDVFRHFIFNVELLFGKKGKPEVFRIAAGYNHQRRGELGLSSLNNLSGFSFGFGLRIKQFHFDYGFGSYHVAGAAHHLGLSISLNEFAKGSSK